MQRRIAKLEQQKIIHREARGSINGRKRTNAYHLAGLIERATPYAIEMSKERKAREELKRARARRGLRAAVTEDEP